jgi:hypothetical protein
MQPCHALHKYHFSSGFSFAMQVQLLVVQHHDPHDPDLPLDKLIMMQSEVEVTLKSPHPCSISITHTAAFASQQAFRI